MGSGVTGSGLVGGGGVVGSGGGVVGGGPGVVGSHDGDKGKGDDELKKSSLFSKCFNAQKCYCCFTFMLLVGLLVVRDELMPFRSSPALFIGAGMTNVRSEKTCNWRTRPYATHCVQYSTVQFKKGGPG